MTKSHFKRKTRSDKFPLTLHPTGQYCKKIKGKLYYFGVDKQKAFQRYLEQASTLHTGKTSRSNSCNDNISIKTLCNLYLEYQESKMQHKEISAHHFSDQVNSLRKFTRFLGQHRLINEISALDLQNYKRQLVKSYSSKHRINLNLAIMKAMFHWARKNDVLTNIPNIDAVSKMKITHQEKPVFTSEQIQVLLDNAKPQIQAMIWLGLNCGFGCTDCSELLWKHIDYDNVRIRFPRGKTGINRNFPLWPDTMFALKALPKDNERVFNTHSGNAWVRTIQTIAKDGTAKYTNDNSVSKEFAKLLKNTGLKTEKGVGFYTLRRTAATLAAQSGDPFAVQRLLGHADLKMATTYVQDVSEQTDRVINNSRKLIIQDNS